MLTSRVRVVVAVLLLAIPGARADEAIRVRTNVAFAPCLAQAFDAFSRESGLRVVVDVGDVAERRGADVVIGDDAEMTRLLESGIADQATAFDLGSLPWVLVVPSGSPQVALSALAPERVSVMGGPASRAARESLQWMPAARLRVTRDPNELRVARYALVPRSLAGAGEQRPSTVRSLIAVTALITDAPHASGARALLAFLRGERGRRLVTPCLDLMDRQADADAAATGSAAGSYAQSVVDWWLPDCSLSRGRYNDPADVVGRPNAAFLGTKDNYRGIMSLGQGGYVTVDTVDGAVDGRGADVRVYQVTGAEPVTVYASARAEGPFTLVALRQECGLRTPGFENFEHHCDFDLHGSGLSEARYFKIEDGEIYPCLAGDTVTEGADIDAIEVLNRRP